MRKRIHSRSELLIYIQGIRSLPKVFLEEMLTWEAIYKSPHSPSFYSCSEKRWDFTPVACKRVSNHWNFKSRRQPPAGQDLHCITDVPVKKSLLLDASSVSGRIVASSTHASVCEA